MLSNAPVGKLIITGSPDNGPDFALMLNLAKEFAERIIAEDFVKKNDDQQNFQSAIKALLQNHAEIDKEKCKRSWSATDLTALSPERSFTLSS